ncbi:UDP-glucose 4-epimerase [Palleronia aestuarii]|uniref:UDP-glucose 4-epimerase n=1 Tax=Palleronia aestuarii TaxID=568105 RepID=A0A2W7N0I2_9RHOB|nr:NAD-dependent epimerase/dehydratase family protein [Palleronia aestuarii]PZX13451.1 UDP-glucose 4-epimerase [Palleronia aestuarii]
MSRIVVTGAGGFLGQALVAAAREAGHAVTALSRGEGPPAWAEDAGIAAHRADLAAGSDLKESFAGADAVIHAAAGRGDDAAHARDTRAATEAVVAAMPPGARLVLVSSFSVYAAAGLPDWATLDETSPTEPDGAVRDAYARAKIAQEKIAVAAAQTAGLDLWILRVGTLYGPGHLWTARLGWEKGGRVVSPGGDAPVPAIHVNHAAADLVAAATAEERGWPEDLPVLEGAGHVRIVNLVDPDPPTQGQWLAAIGRGRVVKIPRRPLMKAAGMLDLAGSLVPGLEARLPTGLGEAVLAARFKPLRYSTARAEDRLGPRPMAPFAGLIHAARQ